jgi:RecJ-like exonuclease
MDYLFGNGLIRCNNCGGRFRGKKQREKIVYICSTYNKDSSKCSPKVTLTEEDLTYTISKHLAIQGKNIKGDILEFVKCIEVEGKGYQITYKDGSKSVINAEGEYGVKVKY